MALIIYFAVSIVVGIGPALLARQLKKRFVLWWIYSAVFLPIALTYVDVNYFP